MNDGFAFWKLVDKLNPYRSITDFIKAAGLNYNNAKQQRSDCRIPKSEDLLKIASTLGVSIEYLLTGKEEDAHFNPEPKVQLSPEARFVEESEPMKALVRYCMKDPKLLSALELVMNAQKQEILERIG
ncbi:MAG: hypothetical protein IAC42_02365 [Spirochaetes bacterium]|uniref:HTH cro/C1-type domain-containing protein n=1 Tax=Candidatus Aphodenecus pullistercoris TaxID=2840669 RepID=A0A9D9H8W3_9SPIR|nr:hypothetical protein [Candidatus Aphodenecus pullistercoris]